MLVAARAKVDNFYSTAPLLFQEDILRLEVAVNDSVLVQRVQTLQNGVCKLAHQWQTEALKLVFLNELVEVHAEQLERHADVVAECKVLQHVDDIHRGVLVLFAQVLQDADFLGRLPVKPLLVAHHFECHLLVVLVVVRLDHLAEAALADDFQHLIPVCDMVMGHVNVGALIVVVTSIVRTTNDTLPFLCIWTYEIDLGIGEDLLVLEHCQLSHVLFHGLLWSQRRRLGFAFRRFDGGRAALSTLGAFLLLFRHCQTRPAHRCQPIGLCSQHCPLVTVLLEQLLNVDLLVIADVQMVVHCELIASSLKKVKQETFED